MSRISSSRTMVAMIPRNRRRDPPLGHKAACCSQLTEHPGLVLPLKVSCFQRLVLVHRERGRKAILRPEPGLRLSERRWPDPRVCRSESPGGAAEGSARPPAALRGLQAPARAGVPRARRLNGITVSGKRNAFPELPPNYRSGPVEKATFFSVGSRTRGVDLPTRLHQSLCSDPPGTPSPDGVV